MQPAAKTREQTEGHPKGATKGDGQGVAKDDAQPAIELVDKPVADLVNPALYINRETSWLAFNARVLDQALDARWPLLERLKFLAIYSSNLDEFFMIRV